MLIWPLALGTSLGAAAIWRGFRAKVVLPNYHVLVRIELQGAIVELAPKSEMTKSYRSCEHYVKFFKFMLTSTQRERLRTILTWVFRTHVCLKTPL